MGYRHTKGYSKVGKRLRVTAGPTHHHHRRLTLILAVTSSGIAGWELVHGSVDTTVFAKFIQAVDFAGRKHALIDNVSFHHAKAVLAAFRSKNVTPLYLPPYTPQWQPVEHMFSVLKRSFRSSVYELTDFEDRVMCCVSMADADVTSMYSNTFLHCWHLAQSNQLWRTT